MVTADNKNIKFYFTKQELVCIQELLYEDFNRVYEEDLNKDQSFNRLLTEKIENILESKYVKS